MFLELILLNDASGSFDVLNDPTFQSMRSLLISAYKFSKAGKVKQLRLGNWREKRGRTDDTYSSSTILIVVSRSASCVGPPTFLFLVLLSTTRSLHVDWYYVQDV